MVNVSVETAQQNGGAPSGQGFEVHDELWAKDEATCSPCDNKLPDSH
ncbi:hypothetical protein J7E87_14275 [Streptomyces sp. ISL-1]|nr:hypothetical protein [Streptomyces sp. ISL-1]MBT2390566.1 hypothetical protein [Streptomyces sp. ISL-1]